MDLLIFQTSEEVLELDADDFCDFLGAEAVKDDRLIDAVEKFRAEMFLPCRYWKS
jgi:hypothetical protein